MEGHVRANLLIWSIRSFLANRIVGLLHELVHALVELFVLRV